MYDRDEDIFSDDTWRDPTDDGERALYYLVAVIMFFCGVASVIAGFVEMASPGRLGTENLSESNATRCLFWGVGAFLVLLPTWLLWKESKHWSFRTMTFERFVSGILLSTAAVITLFVLLAAESPMVVMALPQFVMVVFGGLILTYLFGFAGAYFHKVFPSVARYESAFVVDKRVMEDTNAKDAIFDVDDDPVRSRYVVLRNREFGEKRYRVLADIYEVIEPGCVGQVKIVNGVIREFKVTRRPRGS